MQTTQYRKMGELADRHNQDTTTYKQKVEDQIAALTELREHVDAELARMKTLSNALGVIADTHSTRQLSLVEAIKRPGDGEGQRQLPNQSGDQKPATPKAANG